MGTLEKAKGVLSTLLFALRDATAQIKIPFVLRSYPLAPVRAFPHALRDRQNSQAQTSQYCWKWNARL
jgi:hypothetical protein